MYRKKPNQTVTVPSFSDNPNDSFMLNWILKPLFLGQSLHNMGEMEAYLQTECPDIEYTSVKPPQLLNGESSGENTILILGSVEDGRFQPEG